jgi:hypothetical protein
MTATIVLIILFIHWVADFVCQTDWQAKNKSKNNEALVNHILIYSAITTIAWLAFGFNIDAASIFLCTFICHFITDYITSRINSKLYAKGKIHYFFVSIGFDQILHYAQLFFMYEFLIK